MKPHTKRILCIEDDPDTCEFITIWFRQSGFEVVSAGTFAEGLHLAKEERFDLYLIDHRLPDGDGDELIQKIRAFDTDTPIVVTSADVRESTRQKALSYGAQVFLEKPNSPELLTAAVQGLIRNDT
jgi:two-component system, OmpR family, copper resistance phosphate regulon response regulator CusR